MARNKHQRAPSEGEQPARVTKKAKQASKQKARKSLDSEAEVDHLERDINWTESLTWTLINKLTDDDEVRESLFPSPGANRSTAQGGGKTKTEAHITLAAALFKDHIEYGPAYRADMAVKKEHAKWSNKIKNRLDKVVRDVRAHMQDMEQTGHGIMSKDEIDFNLDNRFTNLARKVLADCPWYYEIKVLIGQRPNLQPIGLGNSRTPINESVFRHGRARKVNEDDAEHGNDGHDASSSDGSSSDSGDDDAPRQQAERVVDLDEKSDEDSDDAEMARLHADLMQQIRTPATKPVAKSATASVKVKSEKVKTEKVKTEKPRESTQNKLKKVKLEDKFLASQKEEEKTRRAAMDLKIAQSSADKELGVERVRSQTEVKLERLRLKADIVKKKMEHRERMAAIKAGLIAPQARFAVPPQAQAQVAVAPQAQASGSTRTLEATSGPALPMDLLAVPTDSLQVQVPSLRSHAATSNDFPASTLMTPTCSSSSFSSDFGFFADSANDDFINAPADSGAALRPGL